MLIYVALAGGNSIYTPSTLVIVLLYVHAWPKRSVQSKVIMLCCIGGQVKHLVINVK